MVYINMFATK